MNLSVLISAVLGYTGWFILVWAIATLSLLVITALILYPMKAFDKRPDGTTANWPVFPMLLPFVLSGLIAYYVLGSFFDRYPPPLTGTNKATAELKMGELENRAKGIQDRFSNPKALTIEQLELALTEVLIVTKEFSQLNDTQQKQIAALQANVIEEQKRAEEARKLAQEIQTLTKGQIEAVQLLITKDANESAQTSFVIGILVSFPIGILTSLIASWLYRRVGKEKMTQAAREVQFEFMRREASVPQDAQPVVAGDAAPKSGAAPLN